MKKYFILVSLIAITSHGFGQQIFSLNDAVAYGLTNAPDIQKSLIAVKDADARIKELKSVGLPKVSSTLGYQYFPLVPKQPLVDFITPSVYGVLFQEGVLQPRELGDPNVFQVTFIQPNQLTGSIDASSMIFDGSYIYGLKAAKFYRELTAKEKSVSEFNVKNNIIKAYAVVQIAEENQKTLLKNKTNLNTSLKELKILLDNGFAESLDVERLELSSINIESEIKRVQQIIELSKNVLKFQMNYPLSQEIILSDDIESLLKTLGEDVDKEILNINFSSRPEYAVIEMGQTLNDLDYKQTKAGYYPTVRAFTSVSGNLLRKNLFDNDEIGIIPQAVVGLNINVPIYDGGDKSAKLQRIQLRQDQTTIDKDNFEKSMSLQTINAFNAYTTQKEILKNRNESLEITQKIFDKTLTKFKEGVGSSLEITQAEASLYQAQSAYINTLYDVLTARIELLTSLGK